MKANSRQSRIILILFLIFLLNPELFAKEKISKTIKKEFFAGKGILLTVENKFGHVNINNWDKESIYFEIIISVEFPDKSTGEKILNYIDVDFINNSDEIKVITKFDEKFSRSGFKLFSSEGNEQKKFSVDYSIYMPKNIKLNLVNKFGSVFIDEITERSNIEVKYGALIANKILWENIKPYSQVTLEHSKGYIGECRWLTLNTKHSVEVKIDKSQALLIFSDNSKIHIEEGSSIVARTRFGKISAGSINNLVCISAHTNYQVENIFNKIEITNQHGGINIANVPQNFESIIVRNVHGNIEIGIDPEASYKLTGVLKQCKIKYPESSQITKILKKNISNISGIIGQNTNPSAYIRITSDHGFVKLTR